MTNNISFQGGFLLKRPTNDTVWKEIIEEMPSSKCIVEDFNEYGDKFFAIKTIYDRAMASILIHKKVPFRFYPDINLKSRINNRDLEGSRKIVDSQQSFIENEDEMREFIRAEKKVLIEKYRWVPEDQVEKTYKALELDSSKYHTIIENGITYIRDNNGKIIAKASPNNKKGTNFVYFCTKNDHSDPTLEMFALDLNGNRRYFGPLQAKEFKLLFMKNVKLDLGRKRPQK